MLGYDTLARFPRLQSVMDSMETLPGWRESLQHGGAHALRDVSDQALITLYEQYGEYNNECNNQL